ncbi:RNA 2',3'-cyclic phosphodiesterase [soil metagenome]
MRLFVAVTVPPTARAVLDEAVAPLRERHRTLRWTPAGNWHLTLAFLGETTTGERLRAQIALASVGRAAQPCVITIDGRLGRFGDRVLWAAVATPDGGLPLLARAVSTALRDAGLGVDDRPFRAHLTLARARRGRPVPPQPVRLDAPGLPAAWTASTVVLMASHRGPGGSRYRTVASWPLGPVTGPARMERQRYDALP